MKVLQEWGIPSIAFLVWAILLITVIPPLIRHFKKKAEQTHHTFDDILASIIGAPLIIFLLGLGLNFFIDAVPLPAKWMKYSNAILILLFVLAGYLFLDQLMMEVLRRYSKKVDFLASSAGVMKTLCRAIILGFVFLIILDRSMGNMKGYFEEHAWRKLDRDEEILVLELLELQRRAMLMFTSCGWFFDERSGLETVQIIQYAARVFSFQKMFLKRTWNPPSWSV